MLLLLGIDPVVCCCKASALGKRDSKVLRRRNSQLCVQYKRTTCPHSKNSTVTTAINNLVSLQPSTSTEANTSQIITKPLTTDTENRQLCADFDTITTMSKANSSYPTPKDTALFLMTFVKKETILMTDKQSEMKFRKSFCTTGARNLGVPNLSLHSPIKLDSSTHSHTLNHVLAELKHLRSKMLS